MTYSERGQVREWEGLREDDGKGEDRVGRGSELEKSVGQKGEEQSQEILEDEGKGEEGIWTVSRDKRRKPVDGLHPTMFNEI